MFYRKTSHLKGAKVLVHVNLMIALLLAYIILLASEASQNNQVSGHMKSKSWLIELQIFYVKQRLRRKTIRGKPPCLHTHRTLTFLSISIKCTLWGSDKNFMNVRDKQQSNIQNVVKIHSVYSSMLSLNFHEFIYCFMLEYLSDYHHTVVWCLHECICLDSCWSFAPLSHDCSCIRNGTWSEMGVHVDWLG